MRQGENHEVNVIIHWRSTLHWT